MQPKPVPPAQPDSSPDALSTEPEPPRSDRIRAAIQSAAKESPRQRAESSRRYLRSRGAADADIEKLFPLPRPSVVEAASQMATTPAGDEIRRAVSGLTEPPSFAGSPRRIPPRKAARVIAVITRVLLRESNSVRRPSHRPAQTQRARRGSNCRARGSASRSGSSGSDPDQAEDPHMGANSTESPITLLPLDCGSFITGISSTPLSSSMI